MDGELRYSVQRQILFENASNQYQVQLFTIRPLLRYLNRCDWVCDIAILSTFLNILSIIPTIGSCHKTIITITTNYYYFDYFDYKRG